MGLFTRTRQPTPGRRDDQRVVYDLGGTPRKYYGTTRKPYDAQRQRELGRLAADLDRLAVAVVDTGPRDVLSAASAFCAAAAELHGTLCDSVARRAAARLRRTGHVLVDGIGYGSPDGPVDARSRHLARVVVRYVGAILAFRVDGRIPTSAGPGLVRQREKIDLYMRWAADAVSGAVYTDVVRRDTRRAEAVGS